MPRLIGGSRSYSLIKLIRQPGERAGVRFEISRSSREEMRLERTILR